MYITRLEPPLASSDSIMADNHVANLPLSASLTNTHAVSPSTTRVPPQPWKPPLAFQGSQWHRLHGKPHQTSKSNGGKLAPLIRAFSNRKTPQPRPPPNTSAATAAPTTHKPKPTQLNGQTAAAASTHICRGLTITNHITFPTYKQPRFGPTLPTLSG